MPDVASTTMKVYDAIKEFINAHHYAPSMRELAAATELSSTSNVRYHLDLLQEWGMIERTPGVARSIYLTES